MLNKQPKRKKKRGQKGGGKASRKEGEGKLLHHSLLKRILNYTFWLNMLVSIKICFWEYLVILHLPISVLSGLSNCLLFFTHTLLVEPDGEFFMICCLGLCLYLMWLASDHFRTLVFFFRNLVQWPTSDKTSYCWRT